MTLAAISPVLAEPTQFMELSILVAETDRVRAMVTEIKNNQEVVEQEDSLEIKPVK